MTVRLRAMIFFMFDTFLSVFRHLSGTMRIRCGPPDPARSVRKRGMTRKRLSTPSRVLRRKNRVATQLCRRLPIRHAHPHTCDMRRDDNGCGDPSPPTGPLPFRSALRSPFTSSARTAVSLSAVPFAAPRGSYSSPSQVYRTDFITDGSRLSSTKMHFVCTSVSTDTGHNK